MKKIMIVVSLYLMGALSNSGQSLAADCSLVYDEFDHLMNKEFLIKPSEYVTTVKKRLSRRDYNAKQKGSFLLSAEHKGLGIGIVRTNANQRGKFLFTWGAPFQNGNPSLIIKEAVIHRLVKTGDNPIVRRNIKLGSSFTLDLDTGQIGGKKADIWFHNIDGKTMYVEAINGADLEFPVQSLCNTRLDKAKVGRLKAKRVNVRQIELARSNEVVVARRGNNPANNTPANTSETHCAAKTIVTREVTESGGALITYSDRSTETYDGEGLRIGWSWINPDGSESASGLMRSTAAPSDIVVEPPATQPDTAEARWLENHRQSLLDIIQSMVSEPDGVQNVLAELDTSENTYESIATRSKIIRALSSASSNN